MYAELERMKKCTGCYKNKQLAEFTAQKRGKFGRHSRCRMCMAEYTKGYTARNKEVRAAYNKQYKLENKEELAKYNRAYLRDYYLKNKTEIIKQTSANTANRTKTDIGFRLTRNLRRRLHHALKGFRKSESTMILLGCRIEAFRLYMSAKFVKGMTWNNYGKVWHVDHIKPLALFDLTNEADIRQASHYTNLQPLFAKDNLSKGKKFKKLG